LIVVNQFHRTVPKVEQGWMDDGLDVFGLLGVAFDQNARGSLASANTTDGLAGVSARATYRRRWTPWPLLPWGLPRHAANPGGGS
jgi:hypothetical protein